MRVEIRRIGMTDLYFDVRPIERELRRMIDRELIPFAKSRFKWIASDWSARNKPKIVARKSYSKTELAVHVGPATRGRGSRIWSYLTNGTGPRSIVPKTRKGAVMRFQTGYTARTVPGGRGPFKRQPKRFGPWVSKKIIKSHRIAPRRFEEAIARWMEKPLDKMYAKAIERGVEKAWKGRG